MSFAAQRALIQHLADVESLATIAREGLPDYCIPTEQLRQVYAWALDYYFESGRRQAPSVTAFQSTWGDVLVDAEIPIEEEAEDTVGWALSTLRDSYLRATIGNRLKRVATDIAASTPDDRVEVLSYHASGLIGLATDLAPRRNRVDLREGATDRLLAYEERAADRERLRGMTMGLHEVDQYTYGIHPGELAILGGMAKVGKSYLLARVALREWGAQGRRPVLFTLENTVEMTLDRLACMAVGVSARAWQRGECTDAEVARVRHMAAEFRSNDRPLWVIQPPPGQRSAEAMVRQAQLLEADSILIDQLTFMEVPNQRAPRWEQVRDVLHNLKELLLHPHPVPCLLAHQLSREGAKAAKRSGRVEMWHMAESSEVERTGDWVFGLHRNGDDRIMARARLQLLAARREEPLSWLLDWNIDSGGAEVREILDLEVVS